MYLLKYKIAALFFTMNTLAVPVNTSIPPILFYDKQSCDEMKAALDIRMQQVPESVALDFNMTVLSDIESECELYRGN